ncbi:MAG: ComF family protein [Minisyncoccia bacterium]
MLHRFFIYLKLLYHNFLDLLFPWQCIFCKKESDNPYPLCINCYQKISLNQEFICPYCNKIITKSHHHDFKKKNLFIHILGIATSYQNPIVKNTIHAFKYNNLISLSLPLSKLMIEFLKQSLYFQNLLSQQKQNLIIISVPLNYFKKLKRGYNQVELLAKQISLAFQIPYYDKILIRIKNNLPQVNCSYKERFLNVKDIFQINQNFVPLIKNKTILLIDDVYTTGATLNEAAKILKQNGAQRIIGLVLAKD